MDLGIIKIEIQEIEHKKFKSKSGKDYELCKIRTHDRIYTGFGNYQTHRWDWGDTVEIKVWTEEYKGWESYKFEAITKTDRLEFKIKDLENRIKKLEDQLTANGP